MASKPALMSPAQRRLLIEQPIIVRTIPSHYGWGGSITAYGSSDLRLDHARSHEAPDTSEDNR